MSASIGFIYLLSNPSMPCYYKIGCTERSPHARAAELSNATGVPEPFRVQLYFETEGFQWREQSLHAHLADFRPNPQREFFVFGPQHLPWLFAIFHKYPSLLAFTECAWESDLRQAYEYPDPWVTDPQARDGLLLNMPSEPPIEYGGLRLVA
jgi:hypothetical protein